MSVTNVATVKRLLDSQTDRLIVFTMDASIGLQNAMQKRIDLIMLELRDMRHYLERITPSTEALRGEQPHKRLA